MSTLTSLTGEHPIATRRFPLFVLLMLAALPALRMVQDEGALLSALGMVIGITVVGVIPGLLIGSVAGALRGRSVPEVAALGFAVSFALVQLLTMVALTLHLSMPAVLVALWVFCAAIAGLMLLKPPQNQWLRSTAPTHWIIVALALVLGAALYMQSPWEPWLNGEDAVHVAVARRLAFVQQPSLHNIYWAPDFVYTYPFPGTHFFIAMLSRAARLDPLLVYQKVRLLWGPVALFTLFAAARVMFGSERLAFASALTAAALTLSGAFGRIGQSWGQLAPVSHAADVAMAVLLPALLLCAVNFAAAAGAWSAIYFLAGTLALVLTLTVVHIREVVQFLVYAGAATAVYALVIKDRRLARRFGALGFISAVMVVWYLDWYQSAVGHVDTVVTERKAILFQVIAAMTRRELLTPIFASNYFTVNQQYFFYMWFPVVLLFGWLVVWAYRDRPLVPFVGASLLAYAVIVFVPFVSILYVYLTYYEILFTPVRNSLFFIYLLAGPLLLLASDGIRAWSSRWLRGAAATGVVTLMWATYAMFARVFLDWQRPWYQNAFFLAIIGGYGAALFWGRRRDAVTGEVADRTWSSELRAPFAVFLAAAVLISFSWDSSPLKFDRAESRWTFRSYLAWMPELRSDAFSKFRDPANGEEIALVETRRLMAPPTLDLVLFARQLPINAVMLHNVHNRYASPVFMPQQILMWPMEDEGGKDFNARLFPVAWAAHVRTARAKRVQPFFNDVETLDERVAYMREVGASHVLIDPMYYARLQPLFPSWNQRLKSTFDDHTGWAILELLP